MKRGASGLSLVIGVNKPSGMTSHDVVNRCRTLFSEKRVGHAGTLDPLASGVLPVCIGPASRLNSFLTNHDKYYKVGIFFGVSTDTDDRMGSVIKTGLPSTNLLDASQAQAFLSSLQGKRKQLPPTYSAIKVGGVKACDAARKGHIIDLTPRDIEIYDAHLEGIESLEFTCNISPDIALPPVSAALRSIQGDVGTSSISDNAGSILKSGILWNVVFHVSKGTYIRALARDIGIALGCPAHVYSLQRLRVGNLALQDCVTLEQLERIGNRAALDPVRLVGLRLAFLDEDQYLRVANGGRLLQEELKLFAYADTSEECQVCTCTTSVRESSGVPCEGELISLIAYNRLAAIYQYDKHCKGYNPRCVFQVGVIRGGDI